jgi:hypothetical protein
MKIKMKGSLDKKTGQPAETDRIGRELEVIRLMSGRGLFASYVNNPTRAFHSSQVVSFMFYEEVLIVSTLNTVYEFQVLEGLQKWMNRWLSTS